MKTDNTLTRAQAICVCRNIVQLCEELDRAPDDFRKGLQDRAESMEKRLMANSQFPNVTANMDSALRNMWSGLRKWDRDDQYNDDMFYEIECVAEELADIDASATNVPTPRGRETGDKSAELAEKYGIGVGTKSQRFSADKPNIANTPKTQQEAPDPRNEAAGPGALLLSDVLRRKESAIGFVLEEIHKAAITILDKASVRTLAIADVLNMTKSDRTQQLIRSAYYVGVLRGIGLLHSKLQNGDG